MGSEQTYNIDIGFQPNTTYSKSTIRASLNAGPRLCPKHEKEASSKNGVDGNFTVETRKPTHKVNVLKNMFGKGSLERKLERHGIKIKVKFHHKRRIQPLDGETPDDNKFLISELRYLSPCQLSTIIETFQSKIEILTKELKEISEENDRMADDQKGLKLTVRNLEDIALRVMKPWVNSMPQSDEMTRVMLLN